MVVGLVEYLMSRNEYDLGQIAVLVSITDFKLLEHRLMLPRLRIVVSWPC